jgi:hypothetical protein
MVETLEQRARRRAFDIAADLARRDYTELWKLAAEQRGRRNGAVYFEDHEGDDLCVDVVVSRLGPFSKRVAVEVTVTGDGWEHWGSVPCQYFEKRKNGAVFWADRGRWAVWVFWLALIIVGLGVAVFAAKTVRLRF